MLRATRFLVEGAKGADTGGALGRETGGGRVGLGGPILESAIIRLATSPDEDVRGVIEWVRTGQSNAFDSGSRLLEILRNGSLPPLSTPSVSGRTEE